MAARLFPPERLWEAHPTTSPGTRNSIRKYALTSSRASAFWPATPIMNSPSIRKPFRRPAAGCCFPTWAQSRYHEFEATLRVRPSDKVDFNISYVNSQARGDLNTMASVYVPYERPVIQPNLFGTLPTNVPDRVVTWGRFKLPQKFIVSPLLDWHSGFPFSIFDDLQNYVGPPTAAASPPSFPSICRPPRISSFPSSPGCVNTPCGARSASSMSPTTATSAMSITPSRHPTSAATPASSIASTTCPWMSCIDDQLPEITTV